MKVVELLKIGGELLKKMSQNDVLRDDWRYVSLYEEYQTMSVMAISKSTDREQFMNSIAHEIGHMKYDICVYYDVEDGSEEEMYLQGYIMQRIVAML